MTKTEEKTMEGGACGGAILICGKCSKEIPWGMHKCPKCFHDDEKLHICDCCGLPSDICNMAYHDAQYWVKDRKQMRELAEKNRDLIKAFLASSQDSFRRKVEGIIGEDEKMGGLSNLEVEITFARNALRSIQRAKLKNIK